MTTEIADGVWRITTPLPFRPREVHAYLLRGDGGWVLVDGGVNTGEAWETLDAGVREAAGGWSEVKLNVITHMHVDHLGLMARVREACGARVAMGRLDAERATHAQADPGEEADYRERLLRENGAPEEFVAAVQSGRERANPLTSWVPVDLALEGEGEAVPGASAWSAVWTPGHTAGHLSLFRASDGLLVAGDAVLPHITPTIGVNRQREDPVGDYLDAMRRLLALLPRRIAPGHGELVTDPLERLRALEAETLAERDRVQRLLGSTPATAWELAERRYADRELPASMRMQALRETLAHLQHLALTGAAAREVEDGVARFTRAA